MKFWLTMIFGIIITSAGLTWLWMKVGDVPMEDPYETSAAGNEEEKPPAEPKLQMILGDSQRQVANVVETTYGDCLIDEEHSAEFKYRNAGDGPLQFVLRRLSCKCLKEFSINGKPVKDSTPVVAGPGEEGVLKLVWLPTDEQLPKGAKPQEQRFTAELYTTDPAVRDLRLEVVVRLINNKE